MLVTDVVPGGRAGAATRPPRGTLRVLSLAVRGEGDSRASLSWRSPLGRCRGGRRRPGRVQLPPGGSASSASWSWISGALPSGPWGLPRDEALWASQALSSLQAGPEGSLVPAPAPGPRRLARAGRALPGLLGAPLCPSGATPPHLCGKTDVFPPPEAWRRCPSAGLGGASGGRAGLKPPGRAGPLSLVPGGSAGASLAGHILVRRCDGTLS